MPTRADISPPPPAWRTGSRHRSQSKASSPLRAAPSAVVAESAIIPSKAESPESKKCSPSKSPPLETGISFGPNTGDTNSTFESGLSPSARTSRMPRSRTTQTLASSDLRHSVVSKPLPQPSSTRPTVPPPNNRLCARRNCPTCSIVPPLHAQSLLRHDIRVRHPSQPPSHRGWTTHTTTGTTSAAQPDQ